MIYCEQDLNIDFLLPIKNHLTDKNIELVFVDDDSMQEINLNTRGYDKTTDVLSFPYENDFNAESLLGSIVINTDMAKKISSELGHSFEDEIKLLFIHAMLHILGYDHECDNGEMREEEAKLMKIFNLPKSLITRTLE